MDKREIEKEAIELRNQYGIESYGIKDIFSLSTI